MDVRSRNDGPIVLAGDPGWDDARRAWNLAFDQRPAAVALVGSVDDVVEVVELARARGLRIAPQSTGHGACSLPPLDDTILLKTSRLRGVEIDIGARRARVEAGAHWGDVVGPAAERGFVVLHGTSPDVGVVGYTLGGGLGWLARSRGLTANSVIAVELVTAEGRLVRADREHEPDLFWAVRGGGGSFGVVTAIELELFEAPELYAGAMFWPVDRAREVLRAWSEWVERVPDEVTSIGRILHFPPIPEIPEPLRGGSFAVVEAVFAGPESDGRELLAPLRALDPSTDSFAAVTATALPELHRDPPEPIPAVGDGLCLEQLPADAIDAIVETAVPPLVGLELRQLGGALAKPSASHGAVGSLEAEFALFAAGLAPTPELHVAVGGAVDRVTAALAPWESERAYFNFSERPIDTARLYPAETYRRLQAIRAKYDPGELFVANHSIPR
jgi:FAD/FMN-containing dehydrogenase